MLLSKLKKVVAVVLMCAFLGTGATVFTRHTSAAPSATSVPPPAEEQVKGLQKQEKEREPFTVWGKEVGGVQAGLGFRPGENRAYHTGETVWLVVRVRNVGKKEVKFSYFNEFFLENPPRVTDGEGKPVPLEGAGLLGWPVLVESSLAPGKEVKVCEMSLELKPASRRDKERPVWKLFGTGKFQLQYENVGGGNIGTREIKYDPVLSKLATGKLELEVKDAERLPEKKEEKEGFTAWGKEIGGLQAGLGFRPGDSQSATRHGRRATRIKGWRQERTRSRNCFQMVSGRQFQNGRGSPGVSVLVVDRFGDEAGNDLPLILRLRANGKIYGHPGHGIPIGDDVIAGMPDEDPVIIELFLESEKIPIEVLARALQRIKAAASPHKRTIVHLNLNLSRPERASDQPK